MYFKNSNTVVVYGIITSVSLWCFDAFIDIIFFSDSDTSIIKSIFFSNGHEIYMRIFIISSIILFTLVTRSLLLKQEDINRELEYHKDNLEKIINERTAELEKLATIDDLTQIYNRRKFFELSKFEIDRHLRYKNPLSLIMIDIDFFKDINDRFGHQAGDKTLQAFSKIILSLIRNTNIFGRIGGEEFAILLPDTSKQDAKKIAERIRKSIFNEKSRFIEHITISLGVTEFYPDDTSNSIFHRADIALYAAKSDGRNKVVTA